jgi:hypothetical protein
MMSLQPEFVFETTDYEGTPMVLSDATWHAKAGDDTAGSHPKIEGYLEKEQHCSSRILKRRCTYADRRP